MKSSFYALIRHSQRLAGPAIVMCALALCSPALLGQAAPAAVSGAAPSRIDIYGGYGYFHPFTSDIGNIQYESIHEGAVASVAGYFNRYLGLQVEGNIFPQGPDDHDCVYSAQGGPILRLSKGRFVPFFHALGGGAKVGGPAAQPCNVWGWGVTGGFGVDYVLPVLNDHLAIRPIQGDFEYSHIDNGTFIPPIRGGVGEIYAYRLSAGVTLRLGSLQPRGGPATLNCSADPSSVYAGDPVTLTASALNLTRDRDLQYLWMSEGGKITGTDATASLDTTGLQPGSYSVSGRLVEGSRQRLIASCITSFAVQPPSAPTVTCAANRAAINSGDPVSITATAASATNRPLTYSYTTSAGQIAGTGATAALTTTGTAPGTITVTCSVADDKGGTASATASVVVATPAPPPPAAQVQSLCGISFDRDRKRPDRVDNEAKGCLDDVALTLNRDPADRLLIVGHQAAGESTRDAENRVLNVRDYLVKEKGVDPGRLDLRISDIPGRSVDDTLLPPGASVDAASAGSFDPASVQRIGQPYGVPGAPAPRHRKRRRHHMPAAGASNAAAPATTPQ